MWVKRVDNIVTKTIAVILKYIEINRDHMMDVWKQSYKDIFVDSASVKK